MTDDELPTFDDEFADLLEDRPHPIMTAATVGLLAYAVLNLLGLLFIAACILLHGSSKP